MKKYLAFLVISAAVFSGCAGKNAVIDKCALDKKMCEAKCKLDYSDSDFKLKGCNAKCETIYLGCRAKEKVKEGYKKTKEYFNKKDKD
jgi:hypothetical protein